MQKSTKAVKATFFERLNENLMIINDTDLLLTCHSNAKISPPFKTLFIPSRPCLKKPIDKKTGLSTINYCQRM